MLSQLLSRLPNINISSINTFAINHYRHERGRSLSILLAARSRLFRAERSKFIFTFPFHSPARAFAPARPSKDLLVPFYAPSILTSTHIKLPHSKSRATQHGLRVQWQPARLAGPFEHSSVLRSGCYSGCYSSWPFERQRAQNWSDKQIRYTQRGIPQQHARPSSTRSTRQLHWPLLFLRGSSHQSVAACSYIRKLFKLWKSERMVYDRAASLKDVHKLASNTS